MKKIKIIALLIFSAMIFSSAIYAQNKSQTAEDLAIKLQQKVLLSNDQTTKVKDIILNYFQDANQSSLESAKKSLTGILDKRQSAKYDIIKNDWWSSVEKSAAAVK